MMADDQPRPRLEISLVQIVASALAAITAAVLASFLGVAGTLVGTAVMSVVATTGSAIYSHSIRRSREQLRNHLVVALRPGQPPAHAPSGVAVAEAGQEARHRRVVAEEQPAARHRLRWKPIAVTAAVVFVIAMAGITVIEAISGESLSAAVQGKPHGSSFTVFPVEHTRPGPTPSPTATPSPGGTPSPSATPSPTASPTPTASPSPTPLGTPPPTSAPTTEPSAPAPSPS